MTNSDDWIRGLLALAGAGICAWLGIEAWKAFEKNWRENNQLGIVVSAGAITMAQAGITISVSELLRALKVPTSTPYISKKKRNPMFLPYYDDYPA
jgi:hypothetical protein